MSERNDGCEDGSAQSIVFGGAFAIFCLVVGLSGDRALGDGEAVRGYWRMDDGVGLKIADSSGNRNDGEARNIRWSAGVHHCSVQFNRGGGITCRHDASLNIENEISIDAWLKPWSPRYPEQPTILRKEGAYALHLGPKKAASLTQNSILGYQAIDMGAPIEFDAPPWVYDMRDNADTYSERPKFENGIRAGNWWTENDGRNDDLWDPEWARDDLILVSMSYYNWIKNYSPLAEKAKNFKLSYIPITNAKRETRRLVGDHVLVEGEVVDRKVFSDRVGYFVWKLDVHHPDGIFSTGSPYDYETNVSPASIPLRILYSKDVPNMFMAGRNVSVTAVTLGTARVQGTTGMMGQIIGTAAAMCLKHQTTPRGLYQSHIPQLQQQLLKDDITIPHV